MVRSALRRTSVLAATAATAGVGIVLAAAPASADLASIRQCESGGNYSTNTGNGFYGAYQFTQQTWSGLGFAGNPASASPAEQDAAAAKLLATAGPGQWPVCGAGSSGGGGYVAPAQTYTYTQPSYTQPSYTAAASRDYSRPAITAPAAPAISNIYGFFSIDNVSQVRDDVRRYQKALNKLHYKVKIDGQYGPQTEAATLKFQKAKKLKLVDGIVGPETFKAAGLK